MTANARELLAKAEAEVAEERRAEPKLPDRPFVDGVVSFLFDPPAALNCGVFAVWIDVLMNMLYGAVYFSDAQGYERIFSVILIALFAMLGLSFVLWFSASCLAIVRDSANGHDKIDDWPGLDITETISVSPYILLSLSVATVPGYVVGQILVLSQAPTWIIFVTCATSLLVLYPLLLLSTVMSGSPIALLSPQVFESLRLRTASWCIFYLFAALLGSLAAFSIWLNWRCGVILGLFCSLPMIASVMIYHRLMGRLAWLIELESAKTGTSSSAEN